MSGYVITCIYIYIYICIVIYCVHVYIAQSCTVILSVVYEMRTHLVTTPYRAHRMGFLAQKVEHQHTKLKVAGLSPAEVHFFSYPEKCCFIQTNQARLGLVALDLINHYV